MEELQMATQKNNDSCKNCLFFVFDDRMGVCRRFPNYVNKSVNDWCGEWHLEESAAIESMVIQFVEPSPSEPKKPRGRPKNAAKTA
jgi:hypothetical protein